MNKNIDNNNKNNKDLEDGRLDLVIWKSVIKH